MHQDNNNPVVKVDAFIVSSLHGLPQDPFRGVKDIEVLNAILSFNGIWACAVIPAQSYTYESRRLFRLELFKMDYEALQTETATLGWSQYHLELSSIISYQHLPSLELASAEKSEK
jgi:hypothetical protein